MGLKIQFIFILRNLCHKLCMVPDEQRDLWFLIIALTKECNPIRSMIHLTRRDSCPVLVFKHHLNKSPRKSEGGHFHESTPPPRLPSILRSDWCQCRQLHPYYVNAVPFIAQMRIRLTVPWHGTCGHNAPAGCNVFNPYGNFMILHLILNRAALHGHRPYLAFLHWDGLLRNWIRLRDGWVCCCRLYKDTSGLQFGI